MERAMISSSRVRRRRILFLLALVLLAGSIPGIGQTATSTTATGPAGKPVTTDATNIEPTAEAVNNQLKRVQNVPNLKDEDRAELVKLYQQALERIQAGDFWAGRIKFYEKIRADAPTLLTQAKAKLAEPVVRHAPAVPPGTTLARLEQKLTDLQAEASSARKQLKEMESDTNLMTPTRRMELSRRISEFQQKADDLRRRQKADPDPAEHQEFRIARRTLLRCERRAVQNQLEALEKELLSFDVRKDLRKAQYELAARQAAEAEQNIKFWQDLVNARRKTEAAQAAELARREAAQAQPEVRAVAKVNAELAEERTRPDGPVTQVETLAPEIKALNTTLTQVINRQENVRKKVESIGLTNSISLLFRKERLNLPSAHALQRRIRLREPKIAAVLTRVTQLEDDLETLRDLDARVNEVLIALPSSVDPAHRLEVDQTVRDLFKTRVDLLESLIGDYNRCLDQLVVVNGLETQLVRKTTEFNVYIDENIFWFRSADSLFVSALPGQAWRSVRSFAHRDEWARILDGLGWDVRKNPLPNVLALAVVVTLVVFRCRRRVDSDVPATEHDKSLAFAGTLKALIQTLLRAGVWPALVFFVVWRLDHFPQASEFTKSVIAGLYVVALLFLTLEILRQICLPQALAERHFKWKPQSALLVRRNLRWLLPVALPAVFLFAAVEWGTDEVAKSSLGRLAFILLMIGVAFFTYRVLGPVRRSLQQSLSGAWAGWAAWTQHVWFPLAVAIPLALALAAIFGYYYSAVELARRLLMTAWLVLALLILREVLVRWVLLAHYNLAARRAARSSEPNMPRPEPEMSVLSISAQARKLLDSFIFLFLVLGLWLIWSDVLPALAVLKKVNLWTFDLIDLILTVVIVAMTFVAARNIPGLLEITVLARMPLDAGLRFAITKVSRYLLIIVGLSLALDTLGFGWSRIQMLVAAMTVGLSFGLQEIFANFVSGLIILFERPMRVGDIVTVGTVSGTVTRIQIRATTILDSDRKELIVPNKAFITDRVINWTLSDRILRLTIPVTITYGSDPDRARQLLLQVAGENPKVIKEPLPDAVFSGFGDNGMHFELAVFTTVDHFETLRHELNTAINHAFPGGKYPFTHPVTEPPSTKP